MLSEAAKAARREYKNAWARRNRDKVRQQQRRYWERKAAAQRSAEAVTDELKSEGQRGRTGTS